MSLNVNVVPDPHDRARGSVDAATLALVEDLKGLAADTLGHGIERMFDGADDMLFEMARRATSNKDQRIYFDTMRVMRLGRPKIGKIFREEIARGFAPAADERQDTRTADLTVEDLSLQESKSLEESIAISGMATKAENLYGHLLFEIGRRFDWLTREKNAQISPSALAPATISLAFRRSAEALDVEFDIERAIFKLFDRRVISDLGELYSRVLRFCDQHGIKPAAISAPATRPAGPQAMAGGGVSADGATPAGAGATPGPSVAQGYGFAQPPMMDVATLDALRSLAPIPVGLAAPGHYGDVQLGAELAAAAAGQIVPGWEAPRAYAYVQRAGAVGQMFNELMQDPTLPAPLKPCFDQLRFSVIKRALHDASFFADRQHPVRSVMNELTTMAAGARAGGMEALRRIEELVGQIQSQFDITADAVRSQTAWPDPVDEKTLEQFFAQQKEDARQRRQAIIERTRRVVAEALQLHTLSRRVPEPAWPLLNSGWAPLAALRLLKQGAGGEGWRDAMDLLGRILDSVDPRRPTARSASAIETLHQDLAARLGDIGMVHERIAALLRSWREGVAQAEIDDDHAPDASPLDAAALLDLLMVLSSWFRVYDPERGQNRWLKVVAHRPADGTVTFAEFNGQNTLQMPTQTFLDDLVTGRAESIDLGPAARRSLDAYLEARRQNADATA